MIPGCRSLKTTIRPALQVVATGALGCRLGESPLCGRVTATCWRSPGWRSRRPASGSVFKIITLAAALQEGETMPAESFPCGPPRRSRACGCATRRRGVRRHADRVVRALVTPSSPRSARGSARSGWSCYAERFGFNERCRSRRRRRARSRRRASLTDDLRSGERYRGGSRPRHAAGDGERGATIANGGVRARPRLVRSEKAGAAGRQAQGRAPGARDDGRGRARRTGHRARCRASTSRQDRHRAARADRRRASARSTRCVVVAFAPPSARRWRSR